ncbi:hypothetical protein G6F68_020017 [Rhizopus microsporus]|nr:hypothetical protein G6F68_020017 [Rhizopus microsporus]
MQAAVAGIALGGVGRGGTVADRHLQPTRRRGRGRPGPGRAEAGRGVERTGSCRDLPEGLAAGRTRIGGHHGQHRSARRDGSGRGDAGPVGAGHAIGSKRAGRVATWPAPATAVAA